MFCFVDAAGIHPYIMQLIALCLLFAELYFTPARLAVPSVVDNIRKGNLFTMLPGMGKDSIRWDFVIANVVFGKSQLTCMTARQQPHLCRS
jgi:hypothetical protein